MSKLRNFLVAVFGFFTLSIAFFIFSEVAWADQDPPDAVLLVPTTAMGTPTATPEGNPVWLIPADQIELRCDHPWVIRSELPVFDLGSYEQIKDDLSECYQLAGDKALESHLWYQGVDPTWVESNLIKPQEQTITLFFDFDADFQSLGLEPPKLVDLHGSIVHDLNADAIFNPGEPIIQDTQICINRSPLSPICVRSDHDGHYRFHRILPGAWHFRISSPTKDRLTEFKYTNQLIEAGHQIPETRIIGATLSERTINITEFNPIENEILLLVDQGVEQNFFLMHEWATYFAAPKDVHLFQTTAHFDLDVRKGFMRVYNGDFNATYDQHDGLDSSCPTGTEIVSVAEGRVIAILYDSTVAIQHTNNLISVYGHGDPLVVENQFVPRGYPVALCNNHLTESESHLHFAVWQSTPWLHIVNYGVPPFADLAITQERWVANQHPLEKNHFVYLLQGGRGIWTEINQPHPPNIRFSE
jgi:murein DD-endopeptidase MepM/ murein hydrolase activator NlpD